MRRVQTIRSILTWLVVACVIPMSTAGAFLLYHAYQREQARIEHDVAGTARALALAVDRDLASIVAALQTLATSPYLTSGDLPAFYAQANEVLGEHIGNNVVLSDESGQQLLNTLRPFGAPLPRHGNPAQLQRVFASGRPVVSDLYVGAVTRSPLVGVEVPVRRRTKVVYDLTMGIFPDRLGKLLSEQHLPSEWVVSIFDSTGTIVARTHDADRFIGQKGSPALLEKMGKVAEGSVETDTLEGIPVLAVFSHSAVSRWTVAIGIPKAVLTAQLWQSLSLVLLISVVLLGLGIFAAHAIGARIARSISGLTVPALALGYGEPVEVPPLRLKEADEVGEALMQASRLIQQRTAERDRAARSEHEMLLAKLRAEHDARHDVLTGLANRAPFNEIIRHEIATCQRTGAHFVIFYIDLDGFKAINDTHGHEIGDELLRAFALRLKEGVRESDMVARLGGDEFAAILVNTDLGKAAHAADKLIETLSRPYAIGALSLEVSASVGVAGYPETAAGSDELLKRADAAMYQAKSAGKRRFAVAAPA